MKVNDIKTNGFRSVIRHYVPVFMLFFVVCLLPFYVFYGKSLFDYADGIAMQYTHFLYVGKWVRTLFTNIFVKHVFEIPMWDMTMGMGSDIFYMTSASVSILTDPIYWISAFVPVKAGEFVFDVVIVLKMFLAGLSYCYFSFDRTRSKLNVSGIVLGAMVYVFSANMLIGLSQANFLNIYYLFPLVMVGADRLWEGKGHRFYVVSLTLLVLYSFYFTYIGGLLIICWCIIRFFCEKERMSFKRLGVLIGRFVLWTLLSIGIGIGVHLPAITNMSGIDRFEKSYDLSVVSFRDLGSIIIKMFSSVDSMSDSYLGFSSVIFLAMVLIIFMKDRKALFLRVLAAAFILSFLFPYIGSVFNGFQYSSLRYAFGLNLLFAYAVTYAYDRLPQIKGKIWSVSMIISAVYLICGVVFSDYLGMVSGLSLLLATGAAGFINMRLKLEGRSSDRAYTLLTLMTCFMIFFSFVGTDIAKNAVAFGTAGRIFSRYDQTSASLELDRHQTRCDTLTAYYRHTPVNSSMISDVMSFDCYNINYDQDLDDYYSDLSVVNDAWGYYFTGLRNRGILQMLNGSEYILKETGSNGCIGLSALYEYYRTEGDYDIYRLRGDASLAYFYDEAVPYDVYEASTVARKEDILTECVVLEGAQGACENVYHDVIEMTGATMSNITVNADGSITAGEDAVITIDFPCVESSEICISIEGLNDMIELDEKSDDMLYYLSAVLYDGDEYICEDTYVGTTHQSRLYHGKDSLTFDFGFVEDKADSIRLYFDTPGTYVLGGINIFARSAEQTERLMTDFYTHAGIDAIDYSIDGNHINLTARADSDKYLYIAVPYSTGWSATVDGLKTEILRANGAFMCIPVSAGEHDIRLDYRTPMLYEGLGLSAVSLVCFILLTLSLNRICCKISHSKKTEK